MEKLKAYLFSRSKKDFADKIGTSPVYLSQLMSGVRKPSFSMARKIDTATDGLVSLTDWES